jgi:hypothetical protein
MTKSDADYTCLLLLDTRSDTISGGSVACGALASASLPTSAVMEYVAVEVIEF